MKKIAIIFFPILVITSQEIPQDFYEFEIQKLQSNIIENWSKNTIFGPSRIVQKDRKSDSLDFRAQLGFNIFDSKKALYAHSHFTFIKNYKGYFYSRIVDKPDDFPRFSGIQRDIKRGGFVSGETDISGISFENDWMIMQFGRGRQSWGAGNDIHLVLSEESNAYDYGMLDLDFGNLRARYFHGYLETDSVAINRYITGRGIEWSNQKNLIIGLSEIVIYSGKNRAIDFSYLNPISTHLEIELNGRPNHEGTDSGNGVWQLSVDAISSKNFRLSANLVFDEFSIDRSQKDNGKSSANAFSLKCNYVSNFTNNTLISIYSSIVQVGTYTFRHEIGSNNFVQRDKPIGWYQGSDVRDIRFGMNYFNMEKFNFSFNFGKLIIGENNLVSSPYDPYGHYKVTPFPSGEVENVSYITGNLRWLIRKNLSIISYFEFNNSNLSKNFTKGALGIDYYYKIKKNL